MSDLSPISPFEEHQELIALQLENSALRETLGDALGYLARIGETFYYDQLHRRLDRIDLREYNE